MAFGELFLLSMMIGVALVSAAFSIVMLKKKTLW